MTPATATRRASFLAVVGVLLTPGTGAAQFANPAQSNPNAVLREMQRQEQQFNRQTAPPPAKGSPVTVPPPPVAQPGQEGGPQFVLKAVAFDRSAFLTQAELDAIAAPYLDHPVGFADLQKIVRDINALYEAKGDVTASAVLAPQKIVDGRVHITLTEGRLGEVKTEGREQTSQAYLDSRLGLQPGEVIDVPELTQRARVLNRTGDVRVHLGLEPGGSFGMTDVTLGVTEPPRNTLRVFVDNQGVQTTGSNEVGVYYKLNGLLGIDDRLTLYGVYSDGDLAGNAGYNLPVGPFGTRIGVSYGRSAIRVVNGPTQPLHVTGMSQDFSVNAAQPVFVNERWTIQLLGSLTYQTSQSQQSGFTISKDNSTREALALSVSYAGDWGSIMVAPSISPVQANPLSLRSARDFMLFTGNAAAQVAVVDKLTGVMNMAWQVTGAKLLPSDYLFQIGGPTTVRGFPTDGLAGDMGMFANLELHYPVAVKNTPIDLFAFSDVGVVASTFPTSKTMTSAGMGASVTLFDRLTVQATVAVPIGLSVPGQHGAAFYIRLIGSVF